MENIVAIEVKLRDGASRYFLTWGRVQDPTDPTALENLVLRHASKFSLGGTPVSAHLCRTVAAASSEPYFYEAFFALAQTRIPFGPKYESWKRAVADLMADGKELYYLGTRDGEGVNQGTR